MKNLKGFSLGLVLGLSLAISGLAFAQSATQNEPKKEGESCCAMTSGCCKGDSCSMKDHADKDHMKTHAAMAGHCCCCGAESCDMKMKHEEEKPKG